MPEQTDIPGAMQKLADARALIRSTTAVPGGQTTTKFGSDLRMIMQAYNALELTWERYSAIIATDAPASTGVVAPQLQEISGVLAKAASLVNEINNRLGVKYSSAEDYSRLGIKADKLQEAIDKYNLENNLTRPANGALSATTREFRRILHERDDEVIEPGPGHSGPGTS
jgi:hypothetical protein